jgi:renalase
VSHEAAPQAFDAVVVGAGIAGLTAAARAGGHGRRVLLLDKSRGVGGRMATRRVGGAVCDHGAQFFTQRTRGFHGVIEQAVHERAAVEWCRGFGRDGSLAADAPAVGDGHPRYRGGRGMTDLPKWLAAKLAAPGNGIEVRTSAKATAVAIAADRVQVTIEGQTGTAEVVDAAGCVLTAPVPQALDLLAAGGSFDRLESHAVDRLRTVDYDPCFALMLVLDRPSLLPEPGAIQFGGDAPGPVAWVADNQQKGISAVPALTVHATGAFSREHFDMPPDEVAAVLVDAVRPWIDGDPRTAVVDRSVHRWKFATPTKILPDPFVAVSWSPPIFCCGDAFAGPRVEGAFGSGAAAGTMLADRLSGGAG